jgi:Domain of unknown function (DUF4062)/HEAT repeats
MASKTPVVMISSTIHDLQEHRQAVLDACLSQEMLPRMMEHLPASDDNGLAESMRLVNEADIYLAIIAHRYGHVPKGKTKSITHYEYEQATGRGIPRLIFIMHDEHPVKACDVEKGDGSGKLEQFKEKLQRAHTVNFFRSPEHLRALVLSTLTQIKKEAPPTTPASSGSTDDDPVSLTAQLSNDHNVDVMQRIGGPCLELKLICRSKRPARISGAKLHVRGPHILAAVQRAFSTDFGHGTGEVQLLQEPDLYIGFLPAARPDTSHGFVIEQDDLRKFFVPPVNGSLLYFAEAPPEDVFLTVEYLDGHSETLLQGVDTQRGIPTLIRMVLDHQYTFHPAIVLPMGLNTQSRQMPDTPPPGILNNEVFHLPPHPRRDEPIDGESDYIRLRAKILRAGAELDMSSEEWLIGVLREHTDREVRRDAIVSLRRLATPRVRDLFVDLLASEINEHARELIIRSFALVGNVEDMSVMERMAREETSRFCRDAAMVAFQYLRQRYAEPASDAAAQKTPP